MSNDARAKDIEWCKKYRTQNIIQVAQDLCKIEKKHYKTMASYVSPFKNAVKVFLQRFYLLVW